MKTLYRCNDCSKYWLKQNSCRECNGELSHPYPARFSLEKEKKFRELYLKSKIN